MTLMKQLLDGKHLLVSFFAVPGTMSFKDEPDEN